jgi:hypothetical protein
MDYLPSCSTCAASRLCRGYGAFAFSRSIEIRRLNSGLPAVGILQCQLAQLVRMSPCRHPVTSPAAHCQPHNQGDSANASD